MLKGSKLRTEIESHVDLYYEKFSHLCKASIQDTATPTRNVFYTIPLDVQLLFSSEVHVGTKLNTTPSVIRKIQRRLESKNIHESSLYLEVSNLLNNMLSENELKTPETFSELKYLSRLLNHRVCGGSSIGSLPPLLLHFLLALIPAVHLHESGSKRFKLLSFLQIVKCNLMQTLIPSIFIAFVCMWSSIINQDVENGLVPYMASEVSSLKLLAGNPKIDFPSPLPSCIGLLLCALSANDPKNISFAIRKLDESANLEDDNSDGPRWLAFLFRELERAISSAESAGVSHASQQDMARALDKIRASTYKLINTERKQEDLVSVVATHLLSSNFQACWPLLRLALSITLLEEVHELLRQEKEKQEQSISENVTEQEEDLEEQNEPVLDRTVTYDSIYPQDSDSDELLFCMDTTGDRSVLPYISSKPSKAEISDNTNSAESNVVEKEIVTRTQQSKRKSDETSPRAHKKR